MGREQVKQHNPSVEPRAPILGFRSTRILLITPQSRGHLGDPGRHSKSRSMVLLEERRGPTLGLRAARILLNDRRKGWVALNALEIRIARSKLSGIVLLQGFAHQS